MTACPGSAASPHGGPSPRVRDPAAWAGAAFAALGAGKAAQLAAGAVAAEDVGATVAAAAAEILLAAALLLLPRRIAPPAAGLALVLGGGAIRLVSALGGGSAACVCLGPYQAWLGAQGTALVGGILCVLLGASLWRAANAAPCGPARGP